MSLAELGETGQLGFPFLIPLAVAGVGAGVVYASQREEAPSWFWDTTPAKVNYPAELLKRKQRIIDENRKKLNVFQTRLDDMRSVFGKYLAEPDGEQFRRRLDEMDAWRRQVQIPRFNDEANYFISFNQTVTRRMSDILALNASLSAAAAAWVVRRRVGAASKIDAAPVMIGAAEDFTRPNPFDWIAWGAKGPSDFTPNTPVVAPPGFHGEEPSFLKQAASLTDNPKVMIAGSILVVALGLFLVQRKGGSRRKKGRR